MPIPPGRITPLTKLAGFAAILIVVFAAASLAGAALNPEVETAVHEADMGEEHALTSTTLPGLAVAEAGYRLVPERTEFEPGAGSAYRFRIVADDGSTVQDFETEHTRRMHLIVVRRDFADFQHLHPTQLTDGSWEARADLEPGVYRAFADFSAGGQSLTLATDLFVSGDYRARPLPGPNTVARTDGYAVRLASEGSDVAFEVSRNGRVLDSVQPYLGADGHLVALREHDQAFLHVHPEGEPGGSGPIRFGVEYPTQGRYRLFLQFKHRGRVHTAAFTEIAEASDGH